MSDYPEVWNFEETGNETLSGALISINAVQAKKFGTDEMVEKFVANIERTEDGTTYAIWLDAAVLNRAFKDEARNRKAIGERFKDREQITIEYLGKRKGEKYTYKDFKVEFEYAAPSLDGFDALAGSDYQGQPNLAEASAEAPEVTNVEAPEAATTEAPKYGDIPF